MIPLFIYAALVLAVNPRGSSSYGPEFLKLVMRDWGGEDFLDLMAAVDQACQRPLCRPRAARRPRLQLRRFHE